MCAPLHPPHQTVDTDDKIRFIYFLRLEYKQLTVRLCFSFLCLMTIKRESQTLSTFLDDEGMVDFESHSPSEEEEKERRSSRLLLWMNVGGPRIRSQDVVPLMS